MTITVDDVKILKSQRLTDAPLAMLWWMVR